MSDKILVTCSITTTGRVPLVLVQSCHPQALKAHEGHALKRGVGCEQCGLLSLSGKDGNRIRHADSHRRELNNTTHNKSYTLTTILRARVCEYCALRACKQTSHTHTHLRVFHTPSVRAPRPSAVPSPRPRPSRQPGAHHQTGHGGGHSAEPARPGA